MDRSRYFTNSFDAAFVEQLDGQGPLPGVRPSGRCAAGIEERQLPQAPFQRVEIILEVGEGARGGEKPHLRAGAPPLSPTTLRCSTVSPCSNRATCSLPPRQTRSSSQTESALTTENADAVQDRPRPCKEFWVEFAAGISWVMDDLGRADALRPLVDIDRDSATVVGHGHGTVGMDR